MEAVELVAVDVNPIGKTIDREYKKEVAEGEYFAVSVIFIENSEGKFLVQKTSERKGGNYSSTGGHVDRGETPFSTILREVKEEIGLDITNEDVKEIGFMVRKHSLAFMYYLKKDLDIRDLTLQESEVESVEYMTPEEIKKLIAEGLITKTHGKIFEEILKYTGKE